MVTEAIGLYDHLRPFRRRLRLLLAWRWSVIGGLGGVGLDLALELLDWWNLLLLESWHLLLPIGGGFLLGVAAALVRPLPPQTVAVMMDRRGNLKDRVQTALERAQAEGVFDQPLIEDAVEQMERLRPAQLFRLRWGAWQSAFVSALALLLFLHYLPLLPFFQSEQKKREQQEVKAIANRVEQVAKPILERAEKPGADELEKRIARNVELFRKRAQQGRMSKKEAMLKMNRILAQARQLEQHNQRRLERVALKTSTATEQLKQAIEKRKQFDSEMKQLLLRMQELQALLRSGKDSQGRPLNQEQIASLQSELQALQNTLQALQNPSNTAMTEAQMQSLQQQIEVLQRQLQSGKDNNGIPLSKEAMEALRQQLQRLQQQRCALQLSKEAREFLRKLMNDPNFIEAMKRLQELAKKCRSCSSQQNSQQRKLTQEEIERLAKELERRLEELARRYRSDEQIRELANQLLEQVKQMKEYAQIGGT